MKKTLKGWIGKSMEIDDLIFKQSWPYPHIQLDEYIFTTKGNKGAWDEEDWPPKKVKVMVKVK